MPTLLRLLRMIPYSLACLTVISCASPHSSSTRLPGSGAVDFTVSGVTDIRDLYGNPEQPDLVIFFGGNEFMVVPELIAAFKKNYPQYGKVFCETLPPGIIAEQIDKGRLTVGNLEITARPDIVTGGRERIEKMERAGRVSQPTPYAGNTLAIMVKAGNPKGVKTLVDLGRNDVRVAMPDSSIEDIGKKATKALEEAGGTRLVEKVVASKVKEGTTYITRIHHRQTPQRIAAGHSDAGPAWLTEALYQRTVGNPLEPVELPHSSTTSSTSVAALLSDAPHPEAGRHFLTFIRGSEARSIYRRYGFREPE